MNPTQNASAIYWMTAFSLETAAVLHFWPGHQFVKQEGAVRWFQLAPEMFIVEVGIGLPNPERVAGIFQQYPPSRILQVGISGALVDNLPVGSIIAVTESIHESGQRIPIVLPPGQWEYQGGQVTVSSPVEDRKRAVQLFEQTGAVIVDMELYHLAAILKPFGAVELMSVRVVSDQADEHARTVIRTSLPRLKQQLRTAVSRLRTALQLHTS